MESIEEKILSILKIDSNSIVLDCGGNLSLVPSFLSEGAKEVTVLSNNDSLKKTAQNKFKDMPVKVVVDSFNNFLIDNGFNNIIAPYTKRNSVDLLYTVKRLSYSLKKDGRLTIICLNASSNEIMLDELISAFLPYFKIDNSLIFRERVIVSGILKRKPFRLKSPIKIKRRSENEVY